MCAVAGVLPVPGRGRTAGPHPGCTPPPSRLDYESHATGLGGNEAGALVMLVDSRSSATPPTAPRSCARTWTGSPSCSAATTASPCSALTRQGEAMTVASPLGGPKNTQGGGIAAAHRPARRAGTGPLRDLTREPSRGP